MRYITYIFTTILLLIVLLMSGCFHEADESDDPVRISTNVWSGYAHAFIAQEKGFFEENGVKVILLLQDEYTDSMKLYENGQADGIFLVYNDLIMTNVHAIPTKAVYVTDRSLTADAIVADPKIKNVSDLKGKIVGYEGFNSFSHMMVMDILKKSGLKESDVYFKLVPAHQVLKELEEGKIQAGHTWEPTKSKALEKGYKIIATAEDSEIPILDMLAFNSNYIERNPMKVKAIIRSLLQANDFIESNPDEALEIMAHAQGTSMEFIKRGLGNVNMLDLEENREYLSGEQTTIQAVGSKINNYYMEKGQISYPVDPSLIIEPRFILELYQETQ